MPQNVTAQEATGQPTLSADSDYTMCIIGRTSANAWGAGKVSPAYSDPATLAAAAGLGDAVDCATQGLTSTQGNPSPPPLCIYQTPATSNGVRGTTLTTSGVVGTAVITKTAATYPKGTYEPVYRVLDDGNNGAGGLIGTAGIILQGSPDGGRTWLPAQALGTAFTISMLIGGEATGVQYDIAPATTNADYVALAVELRADTLAHLANATAHDGADTNAGQVALAASSVPATVTASTAVVNLVLTALQLHVVNITSVHDGPDLVAYTALAALSAATNTKTGIDLAIAIKGILNTHEAASLSNSAAGLLAATATVAAPVTVLAASLLAGGVAAILAQPRRLVFTTGGVTPSDAPASVTIVGTDYADAAQTESALALSQIAGSVTSTKAFKTITSIAYLAADGTGATIAIGYSNGVHNSADATNTITSADPTYGTLFTGDTWSESITTPPMWAVADLYTAGSPPSGAFYNIATSANIFPILVLSEPVQSSDVPTLTAGLNWLETQGRYTSLLVRFRDPNSGETDAQYIAAFQTFRASYDDNRIMAVAGNGWLTDAFRSFVYHRSGLPSVVARLQSFKATAGLTGERIAQHPRYQGRMENFTIVDRDTGLAIDQAHDESLASGIEGPINTKGGGLTFYFGRIVGAAGTYCADAPVMYASDSRVLLWPDRRILNAIKMRVRLALWPFLAGASGYTPTDPDNPNGPLTLDPDVRNAMESAASSVIKANYKDEIQNATDPSIVQVSNQVTRDGARLSVPVTISPLLKGYIYTISETFYVTR